MPATVKETVTAGYWETVPPAATIFSAADAETLSTVTVIRQSQKFMAGFIECYNIACFTM